MTVAISVTFRDVETYRAICGFQDREGYMPSMRELMPLLQVSSTSVVSERLARLESLGWIRRAPNRSRAISLRVSLAEAVSSEAVPCVR